MRSIDPQSIVECVESQRQGKSAPPLHLWHPEREGSIDIEIKRDGSWYHEGGRIQRMELARLFASILRLEADGRFFLVTPYEKLQIRVEDTPFVALSVFEQAATDSSPATLVFASSLGDSISLDREGQFWVEYPDGVSAEPRPLLEVRDGLLARVSRSAFYHLVEMAEEYDSGKGRSLRFYSAGHAYSLGQLD